MLCRIRKNSSQEQRGQVDGSFIIRVRWLRWANSGEAVGESGWSLLTESEQRGSPRVGPGARLPGACLPYTVYDRFILLLVAVENF